MRKWTIVTSAVLALVLATAVTAWAGGGPLTEKQWRGQANAQCRILEDRARGAQRQALGELEPDETPSLAEITDYVALIEPMFEDMLRGIERLREPQSLRKQVGKLLKTGERELEQIVGDPSRGIDGNPFTNFSTRADRLGLTFCT